MYWGDENFRTMTKLGKRMRGRRMQYWKGKKGRVFKNSKLPSPHPAITLGTFVAHWMLTLRSIWIVTFLRKTWANVQCAKVAQIRVGSARRLCLGTWGKGCQIALHNDSIFILARCNYMDVLGGKIKEWKAPNEWTKSCITSTLTDIIGSTTSWMTRWQPDHKS